MQQNRGYVPEFYCVNGSFVSVWLVQYHLTMFVAISNIFSVRSQTSKIKNQPVFHSIWLYFFTEAILKSGQSILDKCQYSYQSVRNKQRFEISIFFRQMYYLNTSINENLQEECLQTNWAKGKSAIACIMSYDVYPPLFHNGSNFYNHNIIFRIIRI